MLDLMT